MGRVSLCSDSRHICRLSSADPAFCSSDASGGGTISGSAHPMRVQRDPWVGKTIPATNISSRYRQAMERLLTIEEIADILQMPPGWVKQQIRMDYLEGVMLGLEWRIEPEALRSFVADRRIMTPLLEAVRDPEPQ